MTLTIIFCHDTVKTVNLHVQAAVRAGNLPRIKHVSALLMLADHRPVASCAGCFAHPAVRTTRYGYESGSIAASARARFTYDSSPFLRHCGHCCSTGRRDVTAPSTIDQEPDTVLGS